MSRLFDIKKLIAKYRIDQPPDPQNADAILAGGRNNPDNWILCDPKRSPEMYARVRGELDNLRKNKPERERGRGHPEPFESKNQIWEWKGKDCCINIADRCAGPVTDFPIPFGGITMVFKCCQACKAMAVSMAQAGLMLSVVGANLAVELPDEPPIGRATLDGP